jgi:Putative prokaryotic signal transducing protein
MTIDPEKERARLFEVYASKSDEELTDIAAHSHELTEIAGWALRNEMGKRKLSAQQLETPEGANQENLDFRDLVTIRSFWGLLEAEMAKGLLDSAGVESFLFDDNMVRLDWFNANALGGVKLRVDPQNVDAANRILQEAAAEAAAETDSGDNESTT